MKFGWPVLIKEQCILIFSLFSGLNEELFNNSNADICLENQKTVLIT